MRTTGNGFFFIAPVRVRSASSRTPAVARGNRDSALAMIEKSLVFLSC
jgi:hypothetical protein